FRFQQVERASAVAQGGEAIGEVVGHARNLGGESARRKFPRAHKSARAGCMSRPVATAIGFSAVLLWSLLAALTAASGAMPPFQLTAVTFAIGGIAGVVLWLFRPSAAKALRQPW